MLGFLQAMLLVIVVEVGMTSGYEPEPAGDRSIAATQPTMLIAPLSHVASSQLQQQQPSASANLVNLASGSNAMSKTSQLQSSKAASSSSSSPPSSLSSTPSSSASSQRFLVEPADARVFQDANVTFRCTIALRSSHVLWLKDGISLSKDRTVHRGFTQYRITGDENAGEYHLMISGAQVSDEGRYYCQVSGLKNKQPLVSKKAVLTVLIPPQATMLHPTNWTAMLANRAAQLQCIAFSSKPTANVSWIVDTNIRGSSIEVAIEANGQLMTTTSTLHLTPNENDHGKMIFCRINGESLLEPVVLATTINVVHPPEVTASIYPKQAVVEHELFTMKCLARANPQVSNWTWFLDKEPIAKTPGDIYVIDAVSRSFNGRTLTCVGSNEYGASNASTVMQVRYPPSIRNERRIEQIDLHGSASISCDVDSFPEASVTWKRVIETTVNGTTKRILREVPNGGSRRLVIRNVTLNEFGEYVCVADTQGLFPAASASFHILRQQPPTITNRGQMFSASRYAKNVQLVCSFQSVPRAKTVVWSKDGVVINNHRNVHRDEFVGGEHAYLVLDELESDSFGDYNCTVINMLGMDSTLIELRQKNQVDIYIVTSCVAGLCVLLVLLTSACIIGVYKRHMAKRRRASRRLGALSFADPDKQDGIIPSPLVTSIHSSHSLMHNGDRSSIRLPIHEKSDLTYRRSHLPQIDQNDGEGETENGSWKPPIKEQQSYVGYKEDDFSLMNVSLSNYCLHEGVRVDSATQQTNANTVSPLASSSGYSSGSVGAANQNTTGAQPPNTPECNGSLVTNGKGPCNGSGSGNGNGNGNGSGNGAFTIQNVNGDSTHCIMHQLGGCSFIMATDLGLADRRDQIRDRNSCVMTVLSNPLVVQPLQTLRSDCASTALSRRSRVLHEAHSCFEPVSSPLIIRENGNAPLRCMISEEKSKKCFYTEL